jgi:hypothetical protein
MTTNFLQRLYNRAMARFNKSPITPWRDSTNLPSTTARFNKKKAAFYGGNMI